MGAKKEVASKPRDAELSSCEQQNPWPKELKVTVASRLNAAARCSSSLSQSSTRITGSLLEHAPWEGGPSDP